MFGYEPDELVGSQYDMLLPERPRGKHRDYCGDFFRKTESRRMGIDRDTVACRKDGTVFPVAIGLNSFTLEGSSYVAAIISDISERREKERECTAEKKKFEAVFDKANDYIVLLDQSGTILDINDKIESIGYDKHEIIGLHLDRVPFLDDEEKKSTLDYFRRRLRGEDIDKYELEFMAKDGSKLTGEINATLVDFGDGQSADVVVIRDITERKRMHRELRESRDYLLNLLDSTLDMIIAADTGHRIVVFNRAAERNFGYAADEIIGHTVEILYDSSEEIRKVRRSMEKTGSFAGEILNRRKNGDVFPSYLSSSTLYDSNGEISGYLGVSRDISNAKIAEQMRENLVRELDTRIRELDCLFTIFTIANRWELSTDSILQQTVDILPKSWQYPEDTCARITLDGTFYDTAGFRETEWRQSAVISIDGRDIGTVEIFYRTEKPPAHEGPFTESERELLDAVADQIGKILDHKHHEEERHRLIATLSEKTNELNTILESIGDAIVTTDTSYVITTVNRAFCDMMDVSCDESIGRRCVDLFRCGKIPGTEECRGKCGLFESLEEMKTSITSSTIETADGRSLVVKSTNSPLVDDGGNVIGVVKSMRDVSKEAEIERMKNEFVATVSHELRTPLTSIKGYIDLLLEGDAGELNDIQTEFIDIVAQNSERLIMLINDLLDIEKLEAGKIDFRKERVSLSDILKNAVKIIEPEAAKKGLAFNVDIADSVFIHADRDRIMQVAVNLLSNAVKFTEKGSVSLSLKTVDDRAVVAVRDTGIGIAEKDRASLFTRFFRADNDYTRYVGGTGLGLSIVKSLVEAHGGTVEVDSAAGEGSMFTVELPMMAEGHHDRE